jgi:hypothetical protein
MVGTEVAVVYCNVLSWNLTAGNLKKKIFSLYSLYPGSYWSRGHPEYKWHTVPLLEVTSLILKREDQWRIRTELESDDTEDYSHISAQNRWNILKNVAVIYNFRVQIWNQSLPDDCRLLCTDLCTVTKLNHYHSFIKLWTARKVWNPSFRGFPPFSELETWPLLSSLYF